ncbi:MAG: tail fiber domain-containing protein, partial [Bdellovibrionaceae bacterium]|nr:tail fiber domain-containing protein [Pseudobdellovibrionaceae bacterium]
CSSDARFKHSMRPLGRVTDKLIRVSPKFYRWRIKDFPEKYFGDQEELGLVAQELLEFMPELVSIDGDGFYRIRYQQLPFYLIKGFSEQQEAIRSIDEKYSRKISALEAENIQLKNNHVKIQSNIYQMTQQMEIIQSQNQLLLKKLKALEQKFVDEK